MDCPAWGDYYVHQVSGQERVGRSLILSIFGAPARHGSNFKYVRIVIGFQICLTAGGGSYYTLEGHVPHNQARTEIESSPVEINSKMQYSTVADSDLGADGSRPTGAQLRCHCKPSVRASTFFSDNVGMHTTDRLLHAFTSSKANAKRWDEPSFRFPRRQGGRAASA